MNEMSGKEEGDGWWKRANMVLARFQRDEKCGHQPVQPAIINLPTVAQYSLFDIAIHDM